MVRFSQRVPSDLRPNRLASTRGRLGSVPFDLTVSNPTLCELAYPDGILRALSDPRGIEYAPDPRGPIAARGAVSETYVQWGVDVAPEFVVLTASTSEAYSLLFRLLADPGDHLLVPTPSYPLFDQLARLDAVRPLHYALEPGPEWRVDFATLERAPESCRAVVVVHPNNPTGSFIHTDDGDRLVRLCRDRRWALVADEVFLPYPLEPAPGAERSFAETRDCLTFSLGGLSKSVGLPQLKLAWTVVSGPGALVREALDRMEYVSDAYLSVNTPVCLAAEEILERGLVVRDAVTARCRSNLARLGELVDKAPEVTLLRPRGGWSAVLRVPAVMGEEELAVKLLDGHGVAVHPGYLFGFAAAGHLVISLLPPEEVFGEGVRRLLGVVRDSLAHLE
jgi:aspartate/methionine/tyrosine aminotransferase